MIFGVLLGIVIGIVITLIVCKNKFSKEHDYSDLIEKNTTRFI